MELKQPLKVLVSKRFIDFRIISSSSTWLKKTRLIDNGNTIKYYMDLFIIRNIFTSNLNLLKTSNKHI